jgi:hypothetical protein
MKTGSTVAVIVLLAGSLAYAHRLDEYLQGTIISIEKDRVDVEITLTPGVAVFPTLFAEIDTDADGVISAVEQQAYARRVLRDLSLRIDDQPLMPQLLSVKFPAIGQMKGGLGQIQIEFDAALPHGGVKRRLVFENHHLKRIAAFQVNCLVPRDPDIQVLAQNRNYSQSFYELEYVQPGVRTDLLSPAWLSGAGRPLAAIAFLLAAWLGWLWRQRAPVLETRN